MTEGRDGHLECGAPGPQSPDFRCDPRSFTDDASGVLGARGETMTAVLVRRGISRRDSDRSVRRLQARIEAVHSERCRVVHRAGVEIITS